MTYPKPIMGINELADLGYNKNFLRRLVREPDQDFAIAGFSGGGRGKWMIDTEKFAAYLERYQKVIKESQSAPAATSCRSLMRG